MFSSACAEGCDPHRCRLLCICRECECDKGRGDTYEVYYCHALDFSRASGRRCSRIVCDPASCFKGDAAHRCGQPNHGVFLYTHLESRVEHAYAVDRSKCRVKTKSDVFAEGCSFYKLVLLFIIGAFIGDVVETLFCRAAAGVWMSRSSLVWGTFQHCLGARHRHGNVHHVQLP